MDSSNVVSKTQDKLSQAIERFEDSLKTLRTGRASANMLDGVKVEAYGSLMPLKQVGSIVVPEAQQIQITPFDPSNLAAIANAIRNDSSLGLNPTDDGRVVRISIPPLTEERRKELAKQVGQKQEESMISIRNVRHEALDAIDSEKKAKNISEDEAKRLTGSVEEAMNKARTDAEIIAKSKVTEITTL